MNRLMNFLEEIPKKALFASAIVLVGLIGSFDVATGYEISLSLFYLLPVIFAAWFVGRAQAIVISFLSAAVWLFAEVTTGHVYSHSLILLWNAVTRMGIFLILTYSFTTMKTLLARERERARRDYLTGAANAKYFYERARSEIDRSAGFTQPLTVVYLDIDNFKYVNDNFGHSVGDNLLRVVAEALKTTLLSTDIISRLGGDEFAILMPETGHEESIIEVNKVQKQLAEMMKANGWPVTFSMGVVTRCEPLCTLDELVKTADDLMRTAKANGKNTVKYKVYESSPAGS